MGRVCVRRGGAGGEAWWVGLVVGCGEKGVGSNMTARRANENQDSYMDVILDTLGLRP